MNAREPLKSLAIPLDFASILTRSHVSLVNETPLVELSELLKLKSSSKDNISKRVYVLTKEGIRSATAHILKDRGMLSDFENELRAGKYASTKSGAKGVVSLASSIWYDADKYLEFSSKYGRLKMALEFTSSDLEILDRRLAESTLDIATRLLGYFARNSEKLLKTR